MFGWDYTFGLAGLCRGCVGDCERDLCLWFYSGHLQRFFWDAEMLWHHLDVRGCCCLRRILLNYAVFNPDMGYCQGMSDLVAPLLTEIQDESDTFWCFVGLMENTIFISSPRDEDMERQLVGCFSVCLLWVVRMSELIVQRCFTPQLSDTSAGEVVSNNFRHLYLFSWPDASG